MWSLLLLPHFDCVRMFSDDFSFAYQSEWIWMDGWARDHLIVMFAIHSFILKFIWITRAWWIPMIVYVNNRHQSWNRSRALFQTLFFLFNSLISTSNMMFQSRYWLLFHDSFFSASGSRRSKKIGSWNEHSKCQFVDYFFACKFISRASTNIKNDIIVDVDSSMTILI